MYIGLSVPELSLNEGNEWSDYHAVLLPALEIWPFGQTDSVYIQEQLNYTTTKDTNYQVYLQTVLRNSDGQLINITENQATGAYVPHKLADHVFDTLMGKKEIITIDNIKYEKVRYTFSPTLKQRYIGIYPVFSEVHIELNVEGNALVQMKEKLMDYSIWKIHYCEFFHHLLNSLKIVHC